MATRTWRPDTKPNFSNYGKYRVELAAPGGDDNDAKGNPSPYGILGLRQNFNNNPPWSRISGTSQAAPHVTGAIQLVKSKYPWEDYAGLRDRVIMGTDDIPALNPNGLTPFRTGGRLNLAKALQKRTLIGNASARAKVESGDRIIIGGLGVGPPGPCGGVSPGASLLPDGCDPRTWPKPSATGCSAIERSKTAIEQSVGGFQ